MLNWPFGNFLSRDGSLAVVKWFETPTLFIDTHVYKVYCFLVWLLIFFDTVT